jgi:polar amino acid transport system substrate-binding protein
MTTDGVFEEQHLDAAAGVRQPMEEYVAATGGRIPEPAFVEIKQSVGLPRSLDPRAVAAVATNARLGRTAGPARSHARGRGSPGRG